MSDNDSDSDEWGMAELVIPPKREGTTDDGDDDAGDFAASQPDDDDGEWQTPLQASNDTKKDTQQLKSATAASDSLSSSSSPPLSSQPIIIVDLTQIDPNIHSKFDRNGVSDPTKASALRKKVEAEYDEYSKNTSFLADGTVIPCGNSVWRDALVRLRDERPGHYFCPVFPKKK